MRKCISCQEPIPEDKRKDAIYCGKPRCRQREHKKRHTHAANAHIDRQAPHASTVLACPCGRRYLLQVCEMDAQASNAAPARSPSATAQESLTQTVLLTDPHPRGTEPQAPAPEAAVTTVAETVLRTDQQSAEPAPTAPAAANGSEAVPQTDPVTDLVTLEVYFADETDHRVAFGKAVHRQGDGPWTLHPHVKIAFSMGERDRPSLGGKPGAWPKFYGARSPSEHGYDPDLAVMYWNPKLRRGCAASVKVLRDILGEGWKSKLRKVRDEAR